MVVHVAQLREHLHGDLRNFTTGKSGAEIGKMIQVLPALINEFIHH